MLKESKVYKFYEQVKNEAFKITWPSRKESVILTSIVVVVVFIFSMICLVLDYSIHSIIQILLNIG